MSEEEKETFETAYAKLEQIVQKLETGNVELEAALELFKEGCRLTEFCRVQLDTAELTLKDIQEEKVDPQEQLDRDLNSRLNED